jgi:hypothetical protein
MTMANSPTNKNATYIGDAVYAAIDECNNLVLTTENGISVSNIIIIEPEIYPMLERFIKKIREGKYERWND